VYMFALDGGGVSNGAKVDPSGGGVELTH